MSRRADLKTVDFSIMGSFATTKNIVKWSETLRHLLDCSLYAGPVKSEHQEAGDRPTDETAAMVIGAHGETGRTVDMLNYFWTLSSAIVSNFVRYHKWIR